MAEEQEYVALQVITTATLTVPKGTTVEGRTVTLPSGEQLKFWTTAELYKSEDGEEVLEDLTNDQLNLRGVTLEHGDGEVGDF